MLTSLEDFVAVELGRRRGSIGDEARRCEGGGRRWSVGKGVNDEAERGSDEEKWSKPKAYQVQSLLVGPEKSKGTGEACGDGDIRRELREGEGGGEEPGLGSREEASFGPVTCGLTVLSLGAIRHAYSGKARPRVEQAERWACMNGPKMQ